MTRKKIPPPSDPVVLCDDSGREVMHFTTPSGVKAWVATEIPREALVKIMVKLKRKLAKSGHRV